ncbi:ATP-binding cassette domain-containing protein [Pseudomonas aeruginosa]
MLAQTGCVVGVNDLSLTIGAGEIFVIMGPSGSGKSTLVRHFNRLIDPTSGEIWWMARTSCATTWKPSGNSAGAEISMVFQSFGLLPHKSVLDNVAYGLKVRAAKAGRSATSGPCTGSPRWAWKGYEKSYPHQLSAACASVSALPARWPPTPRSFPWTRPSAPLDPLIRADMQDQLLELQKTLHKTIVFITHDLDEAVRIGNRIAIPKRRPN